LGCEIWIAAPQAHSFDQGIIEVVQFAGFLPFPSPSFALLLVGWLWRGLWRVGLIFSKVRETPGRVIAFALAHGWTSS
jgi:hypothetical protein